MKKSDIRYYIAKYSIYVFIFAAFFLVQRIILISLFDIKEYILFGKIYAYEPILAIITFFEVYKGIHISKLD